MQKYISFGFVVNKKVKNIKFATNYFLMKHFFKYLIFISIAVLPVECANASQPALSDTSKYKAVPEIMLFSNFHQGIGGDTHEPNFEIKRATFGYQFYVPKGFSSIIRLDVSPNLPLGQNYNTVNVYLRAMYISWKKGKFLLNTGLVDNMQHMTQQKFWGARYIFKSYLDEYRFLPSIDLGFNGKYDFLDNLSVEFGMMTGTIKDDSVSYGKYYYSLSLNYSPIKELQLKAHSTYSFQGDDLYTVGGFAGATIIPQLRIGAEYNAKFSPRKIVQHGASAYIIYGIIKDKLNLFARYDYLTSSRATGYVPAWTVVDDGMALVAGCDWKVVDFVRLSLNYQGWLPRVNTNPIKSYIYLNVEFRVN
jgi:hypothetical protein